MSDIGVHTVAGTEGYIAAVGIDTGTDTPAADCSDTAAGHMGVGYIVAGYMTAGYMTAGYTAVDHYIDYFADPFFRLHFLCNSL